MILILSSCAVCMLIGYFIGKLTNSEKFAEYVVKRIEDKRLKAFEKTEYRIDMGDRNPFKEDDYIVGTPVEIRGNYIKLIDVKAIGPNSQAALSSGPYNVLSYIEKGVYTTTLKHFHAEFRKNQHSRKSKLDNI